MFVIISHFLFFNRAKRKKSLQQCWTKPDVGRWIGNLHWHMVHRSWKERERRAKSETTKNFSLLSVHWKMITTLGIVGIEFAYLLSIETAHLLDYCLNILTSLVSFLCVSMWWEYGQHLLALIVNKTLRIFDSQRYLNRKSSFFLKLSKTLMAANRLTMKGSKANDTWNMILGLCKVTWKYASCEWILFIQRQPRKLVHRNECVSSALGWCFIIWSRLLRLTLHAINVFTMTPTTTKNNRSVLRWRQESLFRFNHENKQHA